MRRTTLSLLGFALLLTACSSANTPPTGDVATPPPTANAGTPGKPPFNFIPYTDASGLPSPDIRVIKVEAKNFAFVPDVISLKKGEKVALEVTATSGNHSLLISELGINVKVSEGQTVYINVPTDKTGTFTYHCAVPCGPGHLDMQGTLTIS